MDPSTSFSHRDVVSLVLLHWKVERAAESSDRPAKKPRPPCSQTPFPTAVHMAVSKTCHLTHKGLETRTPGSQTKTTSQTFSSKKKKSSALRTRRVELTRYEWVNFSKASKQDNCWLTQLLLAQVNKLFVALTIHRTKPVNQTVKHKTCCLAFTAITTFRFDHSTPPNEMHTSCKL